MDNQYLLVWLFTLICLPQHNGIQNNVKDGIIVKLVNSNTKIQIYCSVNDERLRVDNLPTNITTQDVRNIDVRLCPVPEEGFAALAKHFHIDNLQYLSFKYAKHLNNATLPLEAFIKLSSLITLSLCSNDIRVLPDDFFNNFPELVNLKLDHNILELSENIFTSIPKLRYLSVSHNNLNALPPNIFQKLNILEKLDLQGNKLEKIERTSFNSLHNLTSLDLSFNNITSIDESSFDNLTKVINISLGNNALKNISRRVISACSKLELVNLNGNFDLKLIDNVFSDFQRLKNVYLAEIGLKVIPEELFGKSTNLENIALQRNNIENLPGKLFFGLENLKSLNLSHNKIGILEGNIFQTLKSLEVLDLNNNFLTLIDDKLLRPLRSLLDINLNNNIIGDVHRVALSSNKQLKRFYMNNNRYVYKYDYGYNTSPFNQCPQLEVIDLSNNLIEDFIDDILIFISIKDINISFNRITSLEIHHFTKIPLHVLQVDVSHNNISVFNFDLLEQLLQPEHKLDAYHNQEPATIVNISHNPLNCDCTALDLTRYIKDLMSPSVKTTIDLLYENLSCSKPEIFRDVPVQQLRPLMLTCPLEDVNETRVCDLSRRPFDTTLIVNCSLRNLSAIPELHLPKSTTSESYNRTEMHLEGNRLEQGPTEHDMGYQSITKLYLKNNRISSLKWIPQNLTFLDLRNNLMEGLDYNILQQLNQSDSFNLLLADNPWRCDCTTTNLSSFLRLHVNKIDTRRIKCSGSDQLLSSLTRHNLCRDYSELILILAVIVVVTLCILTFSAVFYYKFHHEIKVWLYARGLCLFFVKEEEIDKDKLYDAFISYSHKDEDFVVRNLVNELESGSHPYELCLHYRNWIPGARIATQVINSVRDSRRTLVVLSSNFLESVWGLMELRTAHTEAISEGRTRVIVVIYGDVDIETLDDELKAYLRTNTYVRWGDPWFWDKIRYAMPHSNMIHDATETRHRDEEMQFIGNGLTLSKTNLLTGGSQAA